MLSTSKYLVKIAVLASAVLLIAGLISYFLYFNKSVSNDAEQWAYFSTYISLFVSISNLIFLGVISYITYKTTSTFNNLQITPLLDLTVKHVDNSDSWYLINCSNTSARNISIRFNTGSSTSNWVACFSLNGGSELMLPWLKFALQIEVAYTDAFSSKYFLTSYKDLVGDFEEISKTKFESILPNRLNNANLLLSLKQQMQIRAASFKYDYDDINDYVNNFAMPVKLIEMK